MGQNKTQSQQKETFLTNKTTERQRTKQNKTKPVLPPAPVTSTVLKSAMEANTAAFLLKPLLSFVVKEENEDEEELKL